MRFNLEKNQYKSAGIGKEDSAVLDAIYLFRQETNRAPSCSELQRLLGKSHDNLYISLNRLQNKKIIKIPEEYPIQILQTLTSDDL